MTICSEWYRESINTREGVLAKFLLKKFELFFFLIYSVDCCCRSENLQYKQYHTTTKTCNPSHTYKLPFNWWSQKPALHLVPHCKRLGHKWSALHKSNLISIQGVLSAFLFLSLLSRVGHIPNTNWAAKPYLAHTCIACAMLMQIQETHFHSNFTLESMTRRLQWRPVCITVLNVKSVSSDWFFAKDFP